MSGLATALAAFAVLRYFRTHAHTESVIRSLVAPLVAGIVLTGAAALIGWQIDPLTGASDTVNLDPRRARADRLHPRRRLRPRLRRTQPASFAQLATTNVDAEILISTATAS